MYTLYIYMSGFFLEKLCTEKFLVTARNLQLEFILYKIACLLVICYKSELFITVK